MLAQLGALFDTESYAAGSQEEADHLAQLATRLWGTALEAGFTGGWEAAFAPPVRVKRGRRR